MATALTQYFQFGSGYIFAVPNNGNLATNPTPQQFKTIQDASLEISFKNEPLRGNLQFPDDVARGDGEAKGKVSIGRGDIALFNQIVFGNGGATTTGIDIIDVKEAQTVPGSSVYTVTVTNAGTFDFDLGVQYAATGSQFTQVASVTTAGQYSVNTSTGVYTFDAADASAAVLISYAYKATTTGTNMVVTNQLQGSGPVCQLVLDQPYKGANSVILYSVRFSSLKQPLKRSGYSIWEIDFDAFCDGSGRLLDWYQGVSG